MELEKGVIDAVGAGADLIRLRELLLEFKQSGGTQRQAYDTLSRVRERLDNSPQEDLILDALDLVVGWCPRHWQVWEEELRT